MRSFLIAAAAAVLIPAISADAATPPSKKMTCPVGGKTFSFSTAASYSTWGERPDGKPYGSGVFPLALPECPDNGLVFFKDYEPEETAKLQALVTSDAYQALRGDVPYYRAYWLMGEMGVPAQARLLALQRAAWQADGQPELRARYLAAFAEETAKLPEKPEDVNWIGMEGRAVNALRELGRFDDATARLAKLPLAALAVAEPKADDKSEVAAQARARRNWRTYFETQKLLIARADASSEPFELIPRRVWAERCTAATGLSENQGAYCTAHAGEIAEIKAAVAKADAELKALSQSRDKSGR